MFATIPRRAAPLKPLRPFSKPIFWSSYSTTSRALHRKGQSEVRLGQANKQIVSLLAKTSRFDFVGQVAMGQTLFVGEGNLSFALSIVRNERINPYYITATTYETLSVLTTETKRNASALRELGAIVAHNVDGANIGRTLGSRLFDNIVFQFPHTGSRDPVEGRNPNYILLRDFLKSARRHLSYTGRIMVTTVDSPHYEGAFQFEEATAKLGFAMVSKYDFDPSRFNGYHHTMTHEDNSALENHSKFVTRVFRVNI